MKKAEVVTSAVFVLVMLAAIGGWGCAEQAPPTRAPTVVGKGPTYEVAPLAWVGKVADTDIVATVNSVPVTVQDLRYQAEQNPDASFELLLQATIDAEVLAQAAVSQRLNEKAKLVDDYRRLLANSYLVDEFEVNTTPDSIPLRLVEAAYLRNKRFYDRAPAHTMVNLQIICCAPQQGVCEDDEATPCFADAYPIMQDVYKQASTALKDAMADPESMIVAMKAFGTELQAQYPRLAFDATDFYYDPRLTHKEQLGRYDMMDENIAAALFKLPLGYLTEPIRTPWGWHVAARVKTWPERRDTLDDPAVVQEVRTKALPAFTRLAFAREMDKAARGAKVEIFADRLLALDEAMGVKEKK